MNCIIGIDIGTTNIKAIAFDEQGGALVSASQPTPINNLDDGHAVYYPDEIWQIVTRLLSNITKNMPEEASIYGMAVTGMGEAAVPLGKDGEPLYPIIAWYDKRTQDISSWWEKSFDQKRLAEITGQKAQYILTANKYIWIKQNRPDIHAKIWKWACMEGFIAYKLTGNLAMEHSIASRTMLMDISIRQWSDELLAHSGLSKDILPELISAGKEIGKTNDEVYKKSAIPVGTPVFAGGHDHICGALAVGALEKGDILNSSGTAELILAIAPNTRAAKIQGAKGFNVGAHVVPNKVYMSAGITASGVVLDWLYKTFPSEKLDLKNSGANNLLFLPHLRGSSSPSRDPMSKGSFIGITDKHTESDFYQAVYEGLCFETKLVLEKLVTYSPKRIIVIGGGSRNSHWMQTKADILQVPIEISSVHEATALGAAMLAGIGAGIYKDVADAVSKVSKKNTIITPNHSLDEMYKDKFNTYKLLEGTLAHINSMLK